MGVVTREDSSFIVACNKKSDSVDSAAMMYQLKSNGDSVWSTLLQGFVGHNGVPLQKTGNSLFILCYSHAATGDTTIGVIVAQKITAKVAAGYHLLMFLKPDGTLWSCGHNVYGQLGDGTTTERHTPVQIQVGN